MLAQSPTFKGSQMVNLVDGWIFSGTAYVRGKASGDVVASDLELSFWGGVDPWTGEVIDRHHPLSGRSLKDHILAIPGVGDPALEVA